MKPILLLSLLFLAPTAMATPTDAGVPSASGSAPTSTADGERRICRMERKLGSNRAIRVCRTAAQVEAEREAAQQALRNGGDRTSGGL